MRPNAEVRPVFPALALLARSCGYCTPGQICSAIAVLEEHAAGWPSAVTDDVGPEAGPPPLTPEEIREKMSGNLCRCGAYVSIVQAVARAAEAKEAAA